MAGYKALGLALMAMCMGADTEVSVKDKIRLSDGWIFLRHDISNMIDQHFDHPSVIVWELDNENVTLSYYF